MMESAEQRPRLTQTVEVVSKWHVSNKKRDGLVLVTYLAEVGRGRLERRGKCLRSTLSL